MPISLSICYLTFTVSNTFLCTQAFCRKQSMYYLLEITYRHRPLQYSSCGSRQQDTHALLVVLQYTDIALFCTVVQLITFTGDLLILKAKFNTQKKIKNRAHLSPPCCSLPPQTATHKHSLKNWNKTKLFLEGELKEHCNWTLKRK